MGSADSTPEHPEVQGALAPSACNIPSKSASPRGGGSGSPLPPVPALFLLGGFMSQCDPHGTDSGLRPELHPLSKRHREQTVCQALGRERTQSESTHVRSHSFAPRTCPERQLRARCCAQCWGDLVWPPHLQRAGPRSKGGAAEAATHQRLQKPPFT